MSVREDTAIDSRKKRIEQDEASAESSVQLLTFLQGNEIYGIHIDTVREVIDVIDITQIPLVPNYIRGVINLRGNVIPVIDLKARFHSVPSEIKKTTSIIINEIKYEDDIVEIGLLIDQVKEVILLPQSNIDQTPDFGTKIRTDYIAGIGREKETYIIILDKATVLDIDELSRFSTERINVD